MIDIPTIPLKKDYIYKETASGNLELTFLEPLVQKYDKAPLLFMIPGGGWHIEYRQWMIDFVPVVVESLRKEGFAVASIDYRVFSDGVCMHDILTDCFDAIRYLVKYAQVFGIDKSSVVTIGHSAGAHLALMVGYAPQNKFYDEKSVIKMFGVKGVVALSPATVLYDKSYHELNDCTDLFDEKTMERDMKAAEPISYVSPSCPPTFLAAGTLDPLIHHTSSELLYDMLKKAGVEAELHISVGGGHDYEQKDDEEVPTISKVDPCNGL